MNYFKAIEFACRDHCGLDAFDPKMLKILNEVREELGFPIIITSGCRCEKHNAAVGGVPNSAHLLGPDGWCHAVDVKCVSDFTRGRLLEAFQKRGIRRFEASEIHLHADNSPYLPRPVLASKRFLS
jgi:zinc D-Ala-D-Ala carboxypeptidase